MDDSTQRHRVAASADLWAGLMAHVAPALLGEPNLRLSRPSAGELRYGNRGSLVVHVLPHQRAGRWHDFETGDGGGLEKRTRGEPRDGVCIFGNPHPEDDQDPAHVAEGIADALALSSRYPGPAVAAIGTSGLASVALATWLASLDASAVIVADADPVNPRTGQRPGQVAAGKLRWRIQQQGGSATALWPTAGKDFADLAAGDPFPPLGDAFGDYASTIREMFPAWPRWEVARTADAATRPD